MFEATEGDLASKAARSSEVRPEECACLGLAKNCTPRLFVYSSHDSGMFLHMGDYHVSTLIKGDSLNRCRST